MKKIALLFTLLCVVALNSMEPEKPELDPVIWKNLPEDVKPLIIMALTESGDNIDLAICNIIKAAHINRKLNEMINEKYGNLVGFTELVGILGKKFPHITREEIAKKFDIPIAKQYADLGFELLVKVGYGSIGQIVESIKQGADVNFHSDHGFFGKRITPLILAIKGIKVDAVRLLLDFGANPYFKHPVTGTALDLVQRLIVTIQDQLSNEELLQKLNTMKVLIEDVINRKQNNKKTITRVDGSVNFLSTRSAFKCVIF